MRQAAAALTGELVAAVSGACVQWAEQECSTGARTGGQGSAAGGGGINWGAGGSGASDVFALGESAGFRTSGTAGAGRALMTGGLVAVMRWVPMQWAALQDKCRADGTVLGLVAMREERREGGRGWAGPTDRHVALPCQVLREGSSQTSGHTMVTSPLYVGLQTAL